MNLHILQNHEILVSSASSVTKPGKKDSLSVYEYKTKKVDFKYHVVFVENCKNFGNVF